MFSDKQKLKRIYCEDIFTAWNVKGSSLDKKKMIPYTNLDLLKRIQSSLNNNELALLLIFNRIV